MSWTRASLFWATYLFLQYLEMQCQREELTIYLDRAYADVGRKIHDMCMRPSPLLGKLT
jgi:hypothetical protein